MGIQAETIITSFLQQDIQLKRDHAKYKKGKRITGHMIGFIEGGKGL